jgi:hypothetical protein
MSPEEIAIVSDCLNAGYFYLSDGSVIPPNPQ